MSKHPTDSLVTAALRHLDPAPGPDLTDAERARADATFARIVATPVDGPSGSPAPVRADRPHRRRNRLLVAGGLTGIAGVALPALLLGGGSAFGSWTPTPESLTGEAAAAAATTCRDAFGVPDGEGEVAVAERRGEWTYLLLVGPEVEATCLMPDDVVGRQAHTDGDGFFGSHTADPPARPAVGPRGIDETDAMSSVTDDGQVTYLAGFVGSSVTGVTLHVSTGLEIEASVAGGRFAVWWPSEEPSSRNPSETWTYTLHLADGTSLDVTG